MRKRFDGKQRIFLCLAVLCAWALLAAGAASAATGAARVTAAVGTALSGDEALEQRAALGEGAELETGDDGNCSLLVDDDVLVELCGGTSLRLERKDGRPEGVRVVRLERGEMRMVVEPQLGEERIEIHTPAAIATILGTTVQVSVTALGVTTITSVPDLRAPAPAPGAGAVRVESSDPSVAGSTTVGAGQQLVVAPGQPLPKRAAFLDPRIVPSLGACLIDFHDVSLQVDRATLAGEKLDEILGEEMADAASADIAAPPPEAPNGDGSQPDNPNSDPPYTPAETVELPEESASCDPCWVPPPPEPAEPQ